MKDEQKLHEAMVILADLVRIMDNILEERGLNDFGSMYVHTDNTAQLLTTHNMAKDLVKKSR